MGSRRQRRQQERRLEAALAAALSEGLKRGEAAAFEKVLRATVSEALNLEVRDVEGFIRDVGPQRALPLITEAAAVAFPARYKQMLSGPLTVMMQAATNGAAPVLGSFDLANPKTAEFFRTYVDRLGRDLSQTSRDNAQRVIREAMDEGLSNPATAERLRERLGELSKSRSELIARNETHRAAISATEIQVRESGVPISKRIWRATNDSRTRESHRALDGVEVGMDEPFPGGIAGPQDEIQCRCYLSYEIDFEALERTTA